MAGTGEIIVASAVVVLAAAQVVMWKRLGRLRRRARRSLAVGPGEHLRLQRQVYDRLAAEVCRRLAISPQLPLEFRSEWGEDIVLFELFFPAGPARGAATAGGAASRGVYIEAGALDGRHLSVSWVFEALGWTGLLVEPNPEQAHACRGNRPGSIVAHAALGSAGSSGTTSLLVPESRGEHARARVAGAGMAAEYNAWQQEQQRDGRAMRRIEVPLSTMDAELERAGFTRVDFASIDVEGAEVEVLRGFDLRRFGVRVLVVEDLSLGDRREVAEHLHAQGYEGMFWVGFNRVYVRRDDAEMMARARRVAETVYSPFVRDAAYDDTAPMEVRRGG